MGIRSMIHLLFAVSVLYQANAQFMFGNDDLFHIQELSKLDWPGISSFLNSQTFLHSLKGNACVEELKLFVNNFFGERSIFLLLLDSGKNINELGDHINCEKDNGRYFLLSVFNAAKLGICAPSSCNEQDFNILKKFIIKFVNNVTQREVINEKAIEIKDVKKSKFPVITKGTIITITIILTIVVASVVSSYVSKLKYNGTINGNIKKIIEAFDIVKNVKLLLYAENRVDPNLNILNGVKTLSMGWISLGHFFMLIVTAPILNILDIPSIFQTRPGYSVFTSASLAVDVFFTLTGFLGILVCTEQFRNPKQNNILACLLIYIHRYIRMLPIYGLAILTVIYIFPYLHDGTVFFTIGGQVKGDCESTWIYNLLYINNLKKINGCCGWSWYIANDFQMYLLIPPLVLLYKYSSKLGYLSVFTLMLASFITQYVLCIKYDLGFFVSELGNKEDNIMSIYYMKPWCRINPFLIGIILAWMYISYKNKEKNGYVAYINSSIINNSAFRYALYVVGLTITTLCVVTFFGFYKENASKTHFEHYMFILFSRPGFIIGLFAVIYPGCLGKARGIRAILGNELLNVLSRVVFSAYMFNMITISFYNATREDGMYFTTAQLWMVIVDIFVLTYVVAFIATLIFEYPVISLSKEFLRPKRQAIVKVNPQDNLKLTN